MKKAESDLRIKILKGYRQISTAGMFRKSFVPTAVKHWEDACGQERNQ